MPRQTMSSTLLLSLLALLGAPALAQEALPPEIAVIIETSQLEGVPSASMESKAREGLAKKVPHDRLIAVLEEMSSALLDARELLSEEGNLPTDASIIAGASALKQGASAPGLARLARLEGGLQAMALVGFADLLGAGFSEDSSLILVERAARSSQPETALSGLATAASTLVARGVPHATAAAQIGEEVAAGRSGFAALNNGPPEHSNAGGNSGNGNSGNGNGNSGSGDNGNHGNGNNGNPKGQR